MSNSRRWRRTVANGSVLALAALTAGLSSLLGAQPALAAGGNAYLNWSIPNVPSGGLSNITFPMTVNPDTVHDHGTYFAQQFAFTNASDVAYVGLQPRPNVNGRERLHTAFSTFQAGASTNDPLCHTGADGGPGVSCAADFDGVYGHLYHLTAAKSGADTWVGTAKDTVTGVTTHIGSWTLPSNNGKITGSEGGFLEYYLGFPTCSTLPRTDVYYGGPTSTDLPGVVGTVHAEGESDDCRGQANYQAVAQGNGLHVTRGWIAGSTTAKPLKNAGSGRCLDDPGSNTANGTQIIIWDCNGGDNQRWTSTSTKALMVNGKCLDAEAGGTTAGTKAILWDCHGGGNQQWTLNTDGSVRGVQSGLCLMPSGAATGNNTKVVLATCNGQTSQRWTRS
ncbi:RICIN domain-containing protein [Longispora sp. NPDC051575]|uniref:RICIN domain-containing protein n=1 Tax=Longispora sp. NPDC051575 TaxID=3154943 RepID=UPI0034335BDB